MDNIVKRKSLQVILLVVVAIIQLSVPAWMILEREIILATGKAYKFETAPVDPSDPFRGKYVALDFKEDEIVVPRTEQFEYGEEVAVRFVEDEKGFARIATVSKLPSNDTDYLVVKISGLSNSKDSSRLYFSYPFDRYYMEESKAYPAEQLYVEMRRDTSHLTYAMVKIKSGKAVLEDVLIDDKPLSRLAEKRISPQHQ